MITDAKPPRISVPSDNYLIALASAERALLVSGDRHLLELADQIPVWRPLLTWGGRNRVSR
jgi:predicted nucleic acid-binding protein